MKLVGAGRSVFGFFQKLGLKSPPVYAAGLSAGKH